jgi:hypothetical protein
VDRERPRPAKAQGAFNRRWQREDRSIVVPVEPKGFDKASKVIEAEGEGRSERAGLADGKRLPPEWTRTGPKEPERDITFGPKELGFGFSKLRIVPSA